MKPSLPLSVFAGLTVGLVVGVLGLIGYAYSAWGGLNNSA